MQLLLKEEAKVNNSKWYFTGVPCANGHVDKRYVNTNICYECKRLRIKRNAKNNPETYKAIQRRSYAKLPKSVVLARANKWKEKNVEKSKEVKRKSKAKHRIKNNKKEAARMREKRKNPLWRLSKNLSKAIWVCLKHNKAGKSWKTFVSFTPEELIKHLEIQFKNGMTWGNYGSFWHVDHVKPLNMFDLNTEFNEAWKLSNLQPLEASINCSKRDRYIG